MALLTPPTNNEQEGIPPPVVEEEQAVGGGGRKRTGNASKKGYDRIRERRAMKTKTRSEAVEKPQRVNVIDGDKNNQETRLAPDDIETVQTPADSAISTVVAPSDPKEENISAIVAKEGANGTIQSKESGTTAENILYKSMRGDDITDDINTLVEMYQNKDSALWDTQVFGYAHGPFQLFDRYVNETSQKLHGKNVDELNRWEHYQTTRAYYDKWGWLAWDAYTNGRYKQFMPNGDKHPTDEDMTTAYNVPEEEVAYLRDVLFPEDWDTAKAVMVGESEEYLAGNKAHGEFVTEANRYVLNEQVLQGGKDAIFEGVKHIAPPHFTSSSANPFEEMVEEQYYVNDAGETMPMPPKKEGWFGDLGERMLAGADVIYKYGDEAEKLELEYRSMDKVTDAQLSYASSFGFDDEMFKNYSKKELSLMYSAWQWTESGEFKKWWEAKSDVEKGAFEGFIEGSMLANVFGDPHKKTLFNYAMQYEYGHEHERTMTENIVAPLVAFANPVDWMSFARFAGWGGQALRYPAKKLYERNILLGFGHRMSEKAVGKHFWLGYATRANALGVGLGGYNGILRLNDMLRASEIEGNEFNAHSLLTEVGKGWLIGASATTAGVVTGKLVKGIHGHLAQRYNLADPAWSPTVSDFIGETFGFTIMNRATADPNKIIDLEGTVEWASQEGALKKAFAETSIFLLALRGITTMANKKGVLKFEEPTVKKTEKTGEELINDYTPEQLTLKLVNKVAEKLAERDGTSVDDVKSAMLQMELPLNQKSDYTIKITNKNIIDAIMEVSKEMGIQGELPLKDVFESVRTEVEVNNKNKLSLDESKQIDIELKKPTKNSKERKEATGDIESPTAKSKKERAETKQKQNNIVKKESKDFTVDTRNDKTPNDLIRDSIQKGDVDMFIEGLNSIIFRNQKKGKWENASNNQKQRSIHRQIKQVIKDIKSSRDLRRTGLDSIKEMMSVLTKKGKLTTAEQQAVINLKKAQKLENKYFTYYETLLKEVAKVTHGKESPNWVAINKQRDNMIVARDGLAKLGVEGYNPLKAKFGFAGGEKASNPKEGANQHNKKNKPIASTTHQGYTGEIPKPMHRDHILHTTVKEDVKTEKVKRGLLNADGTDGWGKDVEYLTPHKTLDGAKMTVNKILGDNYVGKWNQHYAQYFQDAKGLWHFRVYRGKMKPVLERTGGQIGATRIMDKNRWDALVSTEYGSGPTQPDALKPSNTKMSHDIRLERIENNLVTLKAQETKQLDDVRLLRTKLKILDTKKSINITEADKADMIVLEKEIGKLDNSMKFVRKTQKSYIKEKNRLKERSHLIEELNARAEDLTRGTGLGAVGFFDKFVWKKMGTDVKDGAYHLKEGLKALWTKAPHTVRMSSDKFVAWAVEQGMKDKAMLKYLGKNYKEVSHDAMMENMLEMNKKINDGKDMFSNGDSGDAVDYRNVDRQNVEYYGAEAFHHYKDPVHYEAVKKFYTSLGKVFDASVRKTGTTMKQVRIDSRQKENQALVADMVLGGKIVFDENKQSNIYVNKNASLNVSSHYMLIRQNMAELAEMWVADPQNKYIADMFAKHVFANIRMRSEWGRTGVAMQQSPLQGFSPQVKEFIEKSIKDKQGFEAFEKSEGLIEALYGEMSKWDFNEPINKSGGFWWSVAELGRNTKLASGSSYAKSVFGNTTSSALESLVKLSTPWMSVLVDPKRKYSGVTFKSSTKKAMQQFEASLGVGHLLMPYRGLERLKSTGSRSAIYEGLFGDKGALQNGWKLMLEDPQAMMENPYLYNEGYSKHINVLTTTVGKAYEKFGFSTKGMNEVVKNAPLGLGQIRYLQNLHGALDMWWRIPTTMIRLDELATRQAVRELRLDLNVKTPSEFEILKKKEQILDNESSKEILMSDSKEYARMVVFQEQMHSGFAQALNRLRTRQDKWWSGVVNWKNPFVVTYVNVFKKLAEYSPAGMIMYRGRDAWARAGVFGKEARINRYRGSAKITPDRDLLAEVSARSLVGSALWTTMLWGVRKMDEGDLHGDFSNMEQENRDMMNSQGISENSLTINGTNYSFQGVFSPVSDMMQGMVSYLKHPETPWAKDGLNKAMSSLGDILSNNPLATNATDINKLMRGEKSQEWFMIKHGLTDIFVPTLLKQIKGIEDGLMRRRNKTDISPEQTGVLNVLNDFFFDIEGGIQANKHVSWLPTKFGIKELDASRLKDEFIGQFVIPMSVPVNWARGVEGMVDPMYAVVDHLGYPVKRPTSKLSLLGIKKMQIESSELHKQYQKIFVEDDKHMPYQSGIFSDGEVSMEVSPETLQLLHITTGLLNRSVMETVSQTDAYQDLLSKATPIPLTEEEREGLNRDELHNEIENRKTNSFKARRLLREEFWSPTHNAIKEVIRLTYLHKLTDISATANVMKAINGLATTIAEYTSPLEQELSGLLREAVFERDPRSGKYTDNAKVAQTDVWNAYHFLHRPDPSGDFKENAFHILGKYSNGETSTSVLRQEVVDLTEHFHPYININAEGEDLQKEWDKILTNIKSRAFEE